MREELKQRARSASAQKKAASQNGPVDAGIEELIGQIQDIMWKDAGIVRTRMECRRRFEAGGAVAESGASAHAAFAMRRQTCIWQGFWWRVRRWRARKAAGRTIALTIPAHDDKKFLKHSVVKGESLRFV